MTDYISRQAAIDAMTDELDMIDHVPQWVFDRLEKRLKQLPAADVVQVVHAHWIQTSAEDENGNAYYSCSNCGRGESHNPIVEVPYCWKCGAKMDSERKE